MKATLEGKEVEISEPTFGVVKKVTALYNDVLKSISESSLDGVLPANAMGPVGEIIAALLGKDAADVDGMHITMMEAVQFLPVAAEACGLKPREAAGEA